LSAGAALTAAANGVASVAALQGGWAAWLQANYPLEGSQVPTPNATVQAWDASGGIAVLGDADAPVTIVEFSDFQCPYCRRHVLQTLPKIVETYVDTGQVRYVFKDFPLESHPNATKAAEAARCAGAQGSFWAMHDRLFEGLKEWSPQEEELLVETFMGYAVDLGLDEAAFGQCIESGHYGPQVRQNQWEGQQAGVAGTPSFLINDQLLSGAQPFEEFRRIIEAELQGLP
jgi:protein-disulfide isomerase